MEEKSIYSIRVTDAERMIVKIALAEHRNSRAAAKEGFYFTEAPFIRRTIRKAVSKLVEKLEEQETRINHIFPDCDSILSNESLETIFLVNEDCNIREIADIRTNILNFFKEEEINIELEECYEYNDSLSFRVIIYLKSYYNESGNVTSKFGLKEAGELINEKEEQ